MPPLGRLLNLIVDRLVKAGRAKGVKELCPELNWLHDYSTRTLLYNVFENTEDWHNRYFGYDRVDLTVPVYGLAYKQLTCNYVKAKHFATLSLNKIFEYMDPSKIKLVGLSPDIIEMYDALWQEKLRCGRPNVLLMIVINFIQYVGVQLYSVLWVLIHCRVYTRNKKEILNCANNIDENNLNSEKLYSPKIDNISSQISSIKDLRSRLLNYQRNFALTEKKTL